MAGLQVDGCFADPTQYNITYPDLGLALNKTGRAMVYSCSWPAYLPDPVMTSFQVSGLPFLSEAATRVAPCLVLDENFRRATQPLVSSLAA